VRRAGARVGPVVAGVFGLSFFLNLVWENAQAPLYSGYTGFAPHFLVCLLATLGDAAFTTALYLLLALVHRNVLWGRHRTVLDALAVVGLSLVGAVAGELIASKAGWWSYAPSMPKVPGLNVDVAPLLQLAVLALVTFEVVRRAVPHPAVRGDRVLGSRPL